MKRIFSMLLALCLTFALPALGEDLTGRPLADGVVTAVNYVDVVAPMSGTLTSFDLAAGDRVTAGQTLMGFVTTPIYAPEDGEVKTLFAQVGDDAAAVLSRYGTLVGMEPSCSQQIRATIAGAYNDVENKILHLGETLYFRSTKQDRTKGTGKVVSVSNEGYMVDILEGDFEPGESLVLYREDDYEAKSNVGKGTVLQRSALPIQGSGRVSALHVQEGARISKGELLLELVSQDAAPQEISAQVQAPDAGVIASVPVSPGQQVWKGQLLCRVYATDAIEVVAEVDEMDLNGLRVGDTLPVTLDIQKDQVLQGTVTEISALGVTRQNAAYFTIHVAIHVDAAMLGASASVYLNAK